MTPELILLGGLVVVFAGLGLGIAKTLAMEDDEQPEDREKALEKFAAENGFSWKAEQDMLVQSRLPALRVFTRGIQAIHVMHRADERSETIILDLGLETPSDPQYLQNRSDPFEGIGTRPVEDEFSNIQMGPLALKRTLFAFRLTGVAMPDFSVNYRHHADLAKIPPTLHEAFRTVWCGETSEDWIVFHRQLLRATSTREQTVADALQAAEELRDAILAHWGLI